MSDFTTWREVLQTGPGVWWLGGGLVMLLLGIFLLWRRRGRQTALPWDFQRAFDRRLAQLQTRRTELAGLPLAAKAALQDPSTPEGAEVLLWQTLRRALEGAHRRGERVAVVTLDRQATVELPSQATQFQLAQEAIILLEQAPELENLAALVRNWLPMQAESRAGVALFPHHEWHEDWLLARALAALDCAKAKQRDGVYGAF